VTGERRADETGAGEERMDVVLAGARKCRANETGAGEEEVDVVLANVSE
jgi:hypothetical protein